jgi:hypothetical protein
MDCRIRRIRGFLRRENVSLLVEFANITHAAFDRVPFGGGTRWQLGFFQNFGPLCWRITWWAE